MTAPTKQHITDPATHEVRQQSRIHALALEVAGVRFDVEASAAKEPAPNGL